MGFFSKAPHWSREQGIQTFCFLYPLRMVPPFVPVICSQVWSEKFRFLKEYNSIFARFVTVEKAGLSKGFQNHFSEIIIGQMPSFEDSQTWGEVGWDT